MSESLSYRGRGGYPFRAADKPARRLKIVLGCAATGLLCFYSTLAINAVRWSPSLRWTDTGRNEKPAAPAIWAAVKPGGRSVQAGRYVYYEVGCAGCHGIEGGGHVKNRNAKTGQEVPALLHVATDYSKVQLQQRIENGVAAVDRLDPNGPEPPLKMPAFKGRLSREQIDQLIAYLNSLLPEGEQEKR